VLVWIVAAALPDNSGMDVERMNTVEDMHPELARAMFNSGTGREPTADEIAEYERQQAERKATAEPGPAEPTKTGADAPVTEEPRPRIVTGAEPRDENAAQSQAPRKPRIITGAEKPAE
jgi:hypothetical protein